MRSTSPAPDRRDADPGREPLEPQARGIDLLEILARQAAHERAAGLADLDQPLPLERREADAHGCLGDAEPLSQVALHERRPRRQLAADDQVAEPARDPVLDRLAVDRNDLGQRLRLDSSVVDPDFTSGRSGCMLGRTAI